MENNTFLSVAVVISTHGLRGQVKIFSQVENFEDLALNDCIFDSENKNIKFLSVKKTGKTDVYIVKIDNINSIEEAEKYIKDKLFSKKEFLNKNNDFLLIDLIGMEVFQKDANGDEVVIGIVSNVVKYGTNSMMEIEFNIDGNKIDELVPANFNFIEKIDLDKKRLLLKQYDLFLVK